VQKAQVRGEKVKGRVNNLRGEKVKGRVENLPQGCEKLS
jgi:hypothetical protein